MNKQNAAVPIRMLCASIGCFALAPGLVFSAGMCALLCSACQAQPASSSSQPGKELAWKMTATAMQEEGIRSLSGADGSTAVTTREGARCLTTQEGATPPSHFLYFALAQRGAGGLPAAYATVEYYDELPGGTLRLEYDSATGEDLSARYRPAEDEAGGYCVGAKKWRKAVFLMEKPLFQHRQNLGADFRLSGAHLLIRSIRLDNARPAEWDQVDKMGQEDVKPLVHIGPGGQLIVGGFDPARVSDGRPQAKALEGAIPGLELLGVTSHEGYVRWNLCEPAPGKYDWSVYDQFVAVYKRHHLKWVPFLIVGSAYSLPDWYYKKQGSQGYVCLEHGQESDVQSLWNPELRRHVSNFIQAFCDHYRPTGVIESILLGVTGNYGEAIYPASGNDWTADIHGPYHTHAGFWAGDPYAVESFRRWLAAKYGDAARLGQAWGKPINSFVDVRPFLQKDAPDDRAWLDFTDWYIGSMTEWAQFWLKETRTHFPRGDIYLCTGGHAPAEHGANFGEQSKAAAAVGGGVRITNEGSNYRANFSLTRWVASAGRQYGAYFSFEPAGGVDSNGVIARIYNATGSGARGLHYYFGNLFDSEAATANFMKWGGEFKQRKPVVDIAVYYPETYIQLHGNDFLGPLQPLRDCFDFGYQSDQQIADGGLKTVKALVLLKGNIAESRTWKAISEWVRQGGLLLYADGMGRLRTVEGDESFHKAIFGPGADHGKGRVLSFHGDGSSRDYRAFLAEALSHAPEVSAGTRAMAAADGKEDNVFVTLSAPHELLWLNSTDQEVKKGVVLPPFSIVSEKLR